eukprot:715754-Amphidinium_carterae.2
MRHTCGGPLWHDSHCGHATGNAYAMCARMCARAPLVSMIFSDSLRWKQRIGAATAKLQFVVLAPLICQDLQKIHDGCSYPVCGLAADMFFDRNTSVRTTLTIS